MRLSLVFSFILCVINASSQIARAADAPKPAETAKIEAKKTECAALLTEAIPLSWIEKMLAEGKATTAQTQRLREIVQRLGFQNAALSNSLQRTHNEFYTVELKQGLPTNQKQSGRCWAFAGLNMLRSSLIAEGRVPADFEFSENYVYFFSLLEKSNRYLENSIEHTYSTKEKSDTAKLKSSLSSVFEPSIADGGWYEYFMFIVSKYGVVPREAMPETRSSENTGALQTEIKRHLSQVTQAILVEAKKIGAAKETLSEEQYLARVRAIKDRGMRGLWRILATHLGDPPATFEVRSNGAEVITDLVTSTPATITRYTPQQYANDFVKFNPSDYVVVSGTPRIPVGVYERPDSAIGPSADGQPSYDIRFFNMPMQRLEDLAVASIDGGHPVWFASDVSKDVDHNTGIMHPQVYERDSLYNLQGDERLAKLNRLASNFFGVLGPNHAMLLTGYDRPNPTGPVVKFKNENSWGSDVATNGTYHLYREWFHQNVFQIIVNKKFLSAEELKAWEAPAKKLRPSAEIF